MREVKLSRQVRPAPRCGVGDSLPPDCNAAMEALADLWEDPEDETKQDALDRHLASCATCARLFHDLCGLQVRHAEQAAGPRRKPRRT